MQPSPGLGRLIDPIPVDEFKRDYWERKPLVIARDDPGYYRDLLSLAAVDEILTTSSVRSSNLRVLLDGKETPLQELLAADPAGSFGGLEMLYARYREGSTIVLNFLHERWAELAALCRSLAAELSAAFQVNVYLTPRGNRGLSTHYDTHDVFVLQVEGSKHWRLYEAPIRLPLRSQPHVASESGPGEPTHEFDLQAGDLIYMPRGYVHDAASNEVASLHLTVGIHPVTWAEVFEGVLMSAVMEDSRFREGLPPGFAVDERLQDAAGTRFSELADALRAMMSPGPALEDAARQALLGRQPALEGHLLDLEAEPSLQLDTPLRRRPEIQWRLTRDDASVRLEFHGKVIRLPRHVEEDVRFMTEVDEFTAQDLPEGLDVAGRLTLVRALCREGFLTVTAEGAVAGAR